MFKNLLIDKKKSTAWITINRPQQLNALNAKTLKELSSSLDMLEKDKNVKVIIITGSGEKSFVAGADIKEFLDWDKSEIKNRIINIHETVFNRIENLSKPVIAAINGFALGGGLELSMACHFRIASDTAKLGLPEVTLGLIPGYGGTQRLPKLVSKGWANQIILTAEMISAQKALEIGLINEMVAQNQLLKRVEEIADKISKNSSSAIKQAITAVNSSEKEQGLAKEIECFTHTFNTEDFTEGVQAFIEKRKPEFQ